ncbi:MAG: GNAT family N-acetyltransferase, partial [Thermoplasmata archaeon]|nr:GNAT family N-acetyltransferase [Thermoplasmata archaeon]
DRWLFAQSLDAARDADAAADDLLGDGVGRWRPDASFGIEIEGRLVAATLVNELLGALLSEVMVDPAWRRRGLARRLIARSIAAVRSLGLGPLRLVVTVGNDRAEPLYRSMGFQPTPVRGTLWLRLPGSSSEAGEGSSR